MKTTILLLLLFCALCTAGAFGQSTANVSSMMSIYQPIDHPQQAGPQPMKQERSLLAGSSNFQIAHGERPLWEFAPVSQEKPLGDIARALKKQRSEAAKKGRTIWEN